MKINPTNYSVSWIRDRNNEKSLVIKPPYQRKPVWTHDQKAYLIDSILKEYLIPEIYIHRELNIDKKNMYNIVDGQQRIRSILDFLNDDFTLKEEYNPEYTDYLFSDLPDEHQRNILNYTLYAREITDASENDVRNLFRRMNKNVVPLNAQELRHATYTGEFIQTMEKIADNDYWAENRLVNANEIRRMKDVQFISDLFISMMNGIQDKTKEMDNYYQYYEEEGFQESKKWVKRFDTILDVIDNLIPDFKSTRWSNKSDFYTLFLVINDFHNLRKLVNADLIKSSRALLNFADKIRTATKKENKGKAQSKDIADYVNAVTKSTTDKDRRIMRHKIVKSLLKNDFVDIA